MSSWFSLAKQQKLDFPLILLPFLPHFSWHGNKYKLFPWFCCPSCLFSLGMATNTSFFLDFVALPALFLLARQQIHAFSLILLPFLLHFSGHGNKYKLFPWFCCSSCLISLGKATNTCFSLDFVVLSSLVALPVQRLLDFSLISLYFHPRLNETSPQFSIFLIAVKCLLFFFDSNPILLNFGHFLASFLWLILQFTWLRSQT